MPAGGTLLAGVVRFRRRSPGERGQQRGGAQPAPKGVEPEDQRRDPFGAGKRNQEYPRFLVRHMALARLQPLPCPELHPLPTPTRPSLNSYAWAWVTGGWLLSVVRRRPDSHSFEVLPRRWVVERTLAWLGRCRRLSKDYEALPETSEAWVYVALIHLMLKRLQPAWTGFLTHPLRPSPSAPRPQWAKLTSLRAAAAPRIGLATLVMFLVLACEPPSPSDITFERWHNGNSEIYGMSADGSGQTRLTDNPATDESPSWSPAP